MNQFFLLIVLWLGCELCRGAEVFNCIGFAVFSFYVCDSKLSWTDSWSDLEHFHRTGRKNEKAGLQQGTYQLSVFVHAVFVGKVVHMRTVDQKYSQGIYSMLVL